MLWIKTAEHFRLWFYYALFIQAQPKPARQWLPLGGELASLRDA